MNNAKTIPAPVLMYPKEPVYADEHTRQFQGCPTVAVTRGGRIFAGWYSGGTCEPHIENFNLLMVSDDGGKSWRGPLLVIPSMPEHGIQALDIQLWLAPDGSLHVYWVQNNAAPYTGAADQPKRKTFRTDADTQHGRFTADHAAPADGDKIIGIANTAVTASGKDGRNRGKLGTAGPAQFFFQLENLQNSA